VHPGRQQLLLSGTSSKLDKSVLIGTLPLTRALLRSLGYWIGTQYKAWQATAAVFRDQQQLDKSLIGTLPLTSPLLRNLKGYWIGTHVYSVHQAGTAAVIREQQA
jgi:hypothetical protein